MSPDLTIIQSMHKISHSLKKKQKTGGFRSAIDIQLLSATTEGLIMGCV